ncbi:MAG: ribbon-helix-helix domain-containing protein [Thermoplasmata archaeon]|nr:ribbon-helix-helix domain-containing protein [Thermoplasmata archaeon]
MRTAHEPPRSDHFLGVRLTAEEVEQLDRFRTRSGSSTRSDAVRALVRDSEKVGTQASEIPVALLAKLEEVVEDGWVTDLDGAVSLLLTLGLSEFSRLHADRLPKLRQTARDGESRRRDRTQLDRKGRGLLDR